MRNMTFLAVFVGFMDRLERQHLTRMAAQAVIVARSDSRVGFMALIAVQPRHRHLVRECCL